MQVLLTIGTLIKSNPVIAIGSPPLPVVPIQREKASAYTHRPEESGLSTP